MKTEQFTRLSNETKCNHVSYNVEGSFQCLTSVERAIKQVGENEVEVFVVDNDSVDATCEIVKTKFPWVNLIENKENMAFCKTIKLLRFQRVNMFSFKSRYGCF